MQPSTYSPRLVRSFVQDIRATPEQVFPLLCPEREKKWLPGLHGVAQAVRSAAVVATLRRVPIS